MKNDAIEKIVKNNYDFVDNEAQTKKILPKQKLKDTKKISRVL